MIKLGIAGAGNIVPDFLKAQVKVPELEPYAICGSSIRSRAKREALAVTYGIRKCYDSYEEMLQDEQIDVIYLAVPNDLHFSFAKRALEQGFHVLCEKPFCTSFEQLWELISLAEQKNLFLFEAISNQYFPNYRKVKELLPLLGRIRLVTMNFSQYSSRYDAFLKGQVAPAFDPDHAGGALMDLNVYNIHFVTGLFGEPREVHYYPNLQHMPDTNKQIDTSGILILVYPDFTCSLTAAKDCDAPCSINIQGENGSIISHAKSNSFEQFELQMRKRKKENNEISNPENSLNPEYISNPEYTLNQVPERLYYELKTFAEMIEKNDHEFCKRQLEHSLTVEKILDYISL